MQIPPQVFAEAAAFLQARRYTRTAGARPNRP
jgi:hypothetical protein